MMKDITLGQYYPIDSLIHQLDPRIKIVLVVAYIVLIFLVKTFWGLLACFALFLLPAALSRVPIRTILRGLKPILFIAAFTFVINVLFSREGNLIFSWWIIRIYDSGVRLAFFMAVRLGLLVAGSSILTLTTSPIDLTDGLERLLKPLKAVRFPVHEMSMMMTIALRFIPTLSEEADRIMKAQCARGADFDTGGPIKRAMNMVPLMVPLFVGAFRRAEDLAVAMEARCYHGGKGRTRMKILKMHSKDYVALLVLTGAYCGILIGGI